MLGIVLFVNIFSQAWILHGQKQDIERTWKHYYKWSNEEDTPFYPVANEERKIPAIQCYTEKLDQLCQMPYEMIYFDKNLQLQYPGHRNIKLNFEEWNYRSQFKMDKLQVVGYYPYWVGLNGLTDIRLKGKDFKSKCGLRNNDFKYNELIDNRDKVMPAPLPTVVANQLAAVAHSATLAITQSTHNFFANIFGFQTIRTLSSLFFDEKEVIAANTCYDYPCEFVIHLDLLDSPRSHTSMATIFFTSPIMYIILESRYEKSWVISSDPQRNKLFPQIAITLESEWGMYNYYGQSAKGCFSKLRNLKWIIWNSQKDYELQPTAILTAETYECGIMYTESNNKVVTSGMKPWVLELTIYSEDHKILHTCVGTLVSVMHILTVGSCFSQIDYFDLPKTLINQCKSKDWRDCFRWFRNNNYENGLQIEWIEYHPLYDGVEYDVVLLGLTSTIQLSSLLYPICLPSFLEEDLYYSYLWEGYEPLYSLKNIVREQNWNSRIITDINGPKKFEECETTVCFKSTKNLPHSPEDKKFPHNIKDKNARGKSVCNRFYNLLEKQEQEGLEVIYGLPRGTMECFAKVSFQFPKVEGDSGYSIGDTREAKGARCYERRHRCIKTFGWCPTVDYTKDISLLYSDATNFTTTKLSFTNPTMDVNGTQSSINNNLPKDTSNLDYGYCGEFNDEDLNHVNENHPLYEIPTFVLPRQECPTLRSKTNICTGPLATEPTEYVFEVSYDEKNNLKFTVVHYVWDRNYVGFCHGHGDHVYEKRHRSTHIFQTKKECRRSWTKNIEPGISIAVLYSLQKANGKYCEDYRYYTDQEVLIARKDIIEWMTESIERLPDWNVYYSTKANSVPIYQSFEEKSTTSWTTTSYPPTTTDNDFWTFDPYLYTYTPNITPIQSFITTPPMIFIENYPELTEDDPNKPFEFWERNYQRFQPKISGKRWNYS
ncbi:unnamed protein product [Lepeophtheirus salmonis]|uniref:(salmon louse) hypothetical protein n=1 Tax=Lepeophtheirus salmonis TaxID=72036 RepID=A0A7R8HB85_LEPSM|nr:unnamed protein product [Lepeophtheirus salmonis]CAF2977573.1 unnamed protein product [Lepeophtheirus salmonis]